jgi:hypothetical protein
MLIQESILESIGNAKYYSRLLVDTIAELSGFGEDCTNEDLKLIVLNKWITILQDYLDNNFDNNGNLVPATIECLTQDEISDLMAKLNLLICNTKAPSPSPWLLATGFWNDSGKWVDTERWYDTIPIT